MKKMVREPEINPKKGTFGTSISFDLDETPAKNIIELAKSLTKFAISVRNKEDIYKILDEAYEKATTGIIYSFLINSLFPIFKK